MESSMGENCYRAGQNINHGLFTFTYILGVFFSASIPPTPVAHYRLIIGAFVANQIARFPMVDHWVMLNVFLAAGSVHVKWDH